MDARPQIKLENGTHHHQNVVLIRFDYDYKIHNKLKETPIAHWSRSHGCWLVWSEEFNVTWFFEEFGELGNIDTSSLKGTGFLKSGSSLFNERRYTYRSRIKLPKGYLEKLGNYKKAEIKRKIKF